MKACAAVLATVVLLGAQSDPPVFRSTTRLVQLSVIVHDKKGAPVADLKPEDFSVREEGREQKIAFFRLQRSDRLAPQAPKLSPDTYSNFLEQQEGAPTSVSVIVLDTLNTQWEDAQYGRHQILKYLEQVRPDDRIALYVLGRALRVLHDFTTDASALVRKIATYRAELENQVQSSEVDPHIRQDQLRLGLGEISKVREYEASLYAQNRMSITLRAFEAIAQHLANLPGRKNLIWVSGFFPLRVGMRVMTPSLVSADQRKHFLDLESALRALSDAGVAVYPVDARGIIGMPHLSAANTLSTAVMPSMTLPGLETAKLAAERTGGRAAYNTNDVKNSIRAAIEDARVTYELAYYTDFDKPEGQFRRIKVAVRRPDLEVRHRSGYFALKPLARNERARERALATAVWSPLDATAVRLNARVNGIGDAVHAFVQVDPSTLAIEPRGSRFAGKVDILMAQKDDTGTVIGRRRLDTLDLSLPAKAYAEVQERGLIHQIQIAREPSAATLRLVVRDATTGATGSLTVPLRNIR